jgi:rubrerythrin
MWVYKMVESGYNALEAVNLAINMERNGHKFYKEASGRTIDDNGKEMFSKLANDEMAHLYWLITVRQSLIGTGQFGDVEVAFPKWEKEIIPEDLLAFPVATDTYEITRETRELEALELAIQAEKDAVAFYQQAAEFTQDPTGRALFKRLAEWEEDHRRLLESERSYLLNNGFYLRVTEFHMEAPEYLSWWRR